MAIQAISDAGGTPDEESIAQYPAQKRSRDEQEGRIVPNRGHVDLRFAMPKGVAVLPGLKGMNVRGA